MTAATEPVEGEPTSPASGGRTWARLPRLAPARAVLAVLAAAALLAAVLVAWQARDLRQDHAAAVAGEQALASARVHAPEILSYDYRHLDRDFARAQAALTGRFKGDYARTTSTVVKPVALQVHAVVTAEVVAASLIWARPGQAQVLLFVNQETTTDKISGSRLDLNRVRMTLRDAGHGWLVSNIEAL